MLYNFSKKRLILSGGISNPDASVGVCCSHKMVVVEFHPLYYGVEHCRGTTDIKPHE